MATAIPYPEIRINGPVVCFEADVVERSKHIQSLHTQTFAATVNTEIKRLDGYYRACSDWLNNASRSKILVEKLGIKPDDYEQIAKANGYLSHKVLDVLTDIAHEKGHDDTQIRCWLTEAKLVNVKALARQRMLMMESVLHATPIIMRDPFEGNSTGSYGFGDGKKTQIFEGKAEVAGLKYSAVASPRMHGYVFRFAVCNADKDNYHDNNPALILDNHIVDTIEAWHRDTRPGEALDANPLLKNMADSLFPNIHDWIHSWLLYDVKAKSENFKQWGADIFFNVDHLVKNKLVINYELLSMSLHRYVWNTMFEHNPDLKGQLYDKLEHYLDQVGQFGAWVKQKQGPEEAIKQKDYLAYAVLSNICFVIDPNEPRMAAIMARYPDVQNQIQRILGKALDLLHSDIKGVPSQFKSGDIEEVAGYVTRYPMPDEVSAGLKHHRIGNKSGKETLIGGDARKRIYTENMAQYEMLPESIREQIVTIRDSDTYRILNDALAKLPEELRKAFIERVVLDDAGRMFFRINRNEINLEEMDLRSQDKRVLLVRVPEGEQVILHPRVRVSLLEEVKRQETVATDQDVVAFNIPDSHIAEEILRAGASSNIPAMIAKAKDLAASGIDGADDIYPLSLQKAEALFGFGNNGFYERLNRQRYAAQGIGPLVMKLQDGSDQKLFNGAMVYIYFDNNPKFNEESNPDLHFVEQKDFIRTHKEPSGVQGIRPFHLKTSSQLMQISKDVGTILPEFLNTLNQINRTIDYGSKQTIAQGLFV